MEYTAFSLTFLRKLRFVNHQSRQLSMTFHKSHASCAPAMFVYLDGAITPLTTFYIQIFSILLYFCISFETRPCHLFDWCGFPRSTNTCLLFMCFCQAKQKCPRMVSQGRTPVKIRFLSPKTCLVIGCTTYFVRAVQG